MSEAARLRAQKAYSTDPEYLERMARVADARGARRTDVGAGRDAANANDGSKPWAEIVGLMRGPLAVMVKP